MSSTTNVMRYLAKKKIPFQEHHYPADPQLSASEIAQLVGLDPRRVFKTLVTVGKSGEHYVFVIPAPANLDLKKAAQAVGEKWVEMVPQKELLPLTGYVHGGCSPLGMKKRFLTHFDESALSFPTIIFSAGQVGAQVELDPRLLDFPTAALA